MSNTHNKNYVKGYTDCLQELEQAFQIAQLQTNPNSVRGIVHVYNSIIDFIHARRLYVNDMNEHVGDTFNTHIVEITIK